MLESVCGAKENIACKRLLNNTLKQAKQWLILCIFHTNTRNTHTHRHWLTNRHTHSHSAIGWVRILQQRITLITCETRHDERSKISSFEDSRKSFSECETLSECAKCYIHGKRFRIKSISTAHNRERYKTQYFSRIHEQCWNFRANWRKFFGRSLWIRTTQKTNISNSSSNKRVTRQSKSQCMALNVVFVTSMRCSVRLDVSVWFRLR